MKKIIGRVVAVVPAVVLQVAWYYFAIIGLNRVLNGYLADIVTVLFTVLAVVFVTHLVSKRDESAYKLLWAIVIVAMPILGAILYLFLGNKRTGTKLKKNFANTHVDPASIQKIAGDNADAVKADDMRIGQSLHRITESTGFPILKADTTKYYPFGENMFHDMVEDLKKAEKYIYIEYFIIESGLFWDTITAILAEKAANGVEVRVMYDDLGSIGTYSMKDVVGLAKKGIKVIPFNPLIFIKTQLNNRDHRKIMVIDGEVAYSGGVNIADEYINAKEVFGRWKDIGFRITGEGVISYIYMFAEFWNAYSKDKIDINLVPLPEKKEASNGYILPYYDSPMRDEHTSNTLFTEMLSLATDYVWFYTPYLMLGDALYDAFIRAARRGVDVRIIMPGIPDKKMVFRLSRSYYKDLIEAGVKVYEYEPGFVHAKAFMCDDKVCGIGTVNLDYRSLFLHFECNSVFYKSDIIADLKQDYLNSLKECRTIKVEKKNVFSRFLDNVLRLIAPLL